MVGNVIYDQPAFSDDLVPLSDCEQHRKVLRTAEIAISMDGRGAWRDNVFVERLWRTIKYEEVYLRACAGVAPARASIGRYLSFYNGRRPHSSLGGKTPAQAYINRATSISAAA